MFAVLVLVLNIVDRYFVHDSLVYLVNVVVVADVKLSMDSSMANGKALLTEVMMFAF